MNEEIKEWQTQSVKHKVAYVLMMDGISFRYTEETGIVFSAPDLIWGNNKWQTELKEIKTPAA